jgi:hypothetical protein
VSDDVDHAAKVAAAKQLRPARLDVLRELTHAPPEADLCWMLVRAALLYPGCEVLFEQPLKTREDRVRALELALAAIGS